VCEIKLDGGCSTTARGYGIHTQRYSVEEVRRNVKKAVAFSFGDATQRPMMIRVHFRRDEAPFL